MTYPMLIHSSSVWILLVNISSTNTATGLQILLDVTHSTRHKAAARLYLITVFDPAHCTINCHLCSSYMFRPLQGHNQGGTYKDIQVQQILSNICVLFVVVCLFSWRYNPLCLYFHSPVAGFSLLVFEVSW